MRCITLVECAQVEFQGSIFKNAMALGDVDNDGLCELVVGSQDGQLAIFKGIQSVKPWKQGTNLGMIVAIGIGDIFNCKHNSLIVISGEGWCYIFDFVAILKNDDSDVVYPVHTQRIPANVKALIVDDFNGDGFVELVIALTDRVVRSYKWSNTEMPSRRFTMPIQPNGKLVALNKWEFTSQIGNIAINLMADGTPTLLVSHPGGTFIRLKLGQKGDTTDRAPIDILSGKSVAYHNLGLSQKRNQNVSTEIVGFIQDVPNASDKHALPFAIATLDGSLTLVKEDVSLWSLQVDRNLFCVSKLDVTGDGKDEIVACAWDGYTYIVNIEGKTVRFAFGQSVSSFCAGNFSVAQEGNSKALVYATFEGKIYIYYNVNVERMDLVTYKELLNDSCVSCLKSLDVDINNSDKMKELASYLLYKYK